MSDLDKIKWLEDRWDEAVNLLQHLYAGDDSLDVLQATKETIDQKNQYFRNRE